MKKRKGLCNSEKNRKRKNVFKTICSLAFAGLFSVACLSFSFVSINSASASAWVGYEDGRFITTPGQFYRFNSIYKTFSSVYEVGGSHQTFLSAVNYLPETYGYKNGVDDSDGYESHVSMTTSYNPVFRTAMQANSYYMDYDDFRSALLKPAGSWRLGELRQIDGELLFRLELSAENVPMNYLDYETHIKQSQMDTKVSLGSLEVFDYDVFFEMDYLVGTSLGSTTPRYESYNFVRVSNVQDGNPFYLGRCFPTVDELKEMGAMFNDNSFYFSKIKIFIQYVLDLSIWEDYSDDFTTDINLFIDYDDYDMTPNDFRYQCERRGEIDNFIKSCYCYTIEEYSDDVTKPIWNSIEGFLQLQLFPGFKVSFLIMVFCAFTLAFMLIKILR